MALHCLVWTLISCLLLAWLGEASDPSDNDIYAGQFVTANNDFAARLLVHAKKSNEPGNVFLSPFSVIMGLGMLSVAARDQTREEILHVMQVTDMRNRHVARELRQLTGTRVGNKTTNYSLSVANRVWAQESMRVCRVFEKRMRHLYSAPMAKLDFQLKPEASRELVNAWVGDKTMGQIQQLLPPGSITTDTRFLLTNVIYFKGFWDKQFDVQHTVTKRFRTCKENGRGLSHIPMMHQFGQFSVKSSYLHAVDVLEMPYSGGDISMYLLLPHRTTCRAVKELENRLSANVIADLTSDLITRHMDVHLPRFNLTYDAPLSDTLQAMGINLAFNATNADLSGIDCGKHSDLYVSDAFHQAVVVVDEKGTEASGATGFILAARIATPEFRVNRPFLFFIMDKHTRAVLFIGRVFDL